ncbi:major facilitator superfamily domain-containing protein [Kalaharituber pfeilii]|nr:major facilitator superfamily domain-containing protein [Kalaharituber pfeilii]
MSQQLAQQSSVPKGTKLTLMRTTTNPTAIIPRKYRRGFLGTSKLVLIPEIQNPYEYTRGVKHMITALVGLAAAAAPIGSSVLFPALSLISKDFNVSPAVANLTVAMFMGSMGLFPLYWSRLSEINGRRTVYILSFLSFTIFCLAAAVAPTSQIWFLILMRIGAGGSASAVLSVGAGTIADIFEVRERGQAVGWFYLGPLIGPLIAPIIGGGIASKWGWRGTMWFSVFFGFVLTIALVMGLPETLRRKSVAGVVEVGKPQGNRPASEESMETGDGDDIEKGSSLAAATGDNIGSPGRSNARLDNPPTEKQPQDQPWKKQGNPQQPQPSPPKERKLVSKVWHAIIDPLRAVKYIRYPPVAMTIWYGSIGFMCLYILNVSMQQTFGDPPYNFQTASIGLLYISPSVGYFTGSIVGGRWTDRVMVRQAKRRQAKGKGDGKLIPEDRMGENAALGGLLFPIGLLWYGWTVTRVEQWIVPVLATFFFGFGGMIVFGMCTTMLTEFVPGKSSSAVAVQNLIRNMLACIGAIITAPLLDALGEGILFSILAGLGFLSMSIIWLMRKYGPKWREYVGEYDLS